MKLIDKSALVAEIERISDNAEEVHNSGYVLLCNHLKSFIDTLEVKEVDLERLINDYFTGWYFDNELDILAKPNNYSVTVDDVKEIAKYFFELGLKAQKGE